MSFIWLHKKVHWSDTDAAGIVWFPNYFGWFEDAEEELYAIVAPPMRRATPNDTGPGMTARRATPVPTAANSQANLRASGVAKCLVPNHTPPIVLPMPCAQVQR